MKKPVYRCLTNPTNFVGTGRFVEAKFEWVECDWCFGDGCEMIYDNETGGLYPIDHPCEKCQGTGKISKRIEG